MCETVLSEVSYTYGALSYILLIQGTSFDSSSASVWSAACPIEPGDALEMVVGDVNGDGRADAVYVVLLLIKCRLSDINETLH